MFGRLFSGGVERSRSENYESYCGFQMQRSLRNAEASVFGLTLRFLSVGSVASVVQQIVDCEANRSVESFSLS